MPCLMASSSSSRTSSRHSDEERMMASRPAQAEKAYSFENLLGVDGRSYSLSSFDDKHILVGIFSGNGCPTAKGREPRIMELERDYAEKAVQIVLIHSNNSSISPPETFTEREN